MIRVAIVAFVVALVSARCYGIDPQSNTIIVRDAWPVATVPMQVRVPAQRIYVPQVQMVPFELDRTELIRREYRTPLRDLLWGRYRINNYYRPMVQQ